MRKDFTPTELPKTEAGNNVIIKPNAGKGSGTAIVALHYYYLTLGVHWNQPPISTQPLNTY